MDITFLLAWEWFQWIAIRLALFLALLTMGPSIGLIVFDLVLYALRTILGNLMLFGREEHVVTKPTEVSTDQGKEKEIKEEVKPEVVR